jgi:anaerobic selenocysteine-containing dehydrogenase
VLPATTQLEHLDVHTSYGHTYALINEPAIAPLGEARPNTASFARSRRGWASTIRASATTTRRSHATAFRPASAGGVDFDALRARGWVKLPLAEAPFADGGFPTPTASAVIDAPASAFPTTSRTTNRRAARPSSRARFPLAMISPPARNFLNSSFVNVTSLRAIEGEPVLEISARTRRRAASLGRARSHLQRPRQHRLQGGRRRARAAGRRQRPRRLVEEARSDGKNGNELTHQRLTDIGRAPSFYDCLVEVEPRRPGRGVRRGARVVAGPSAESRRLRSPPARRSA